MDARHKFRESGTNLVDRLKYLSFSLLFSGICNAQNIPIGQWESHFSYSSAQHVVQAGKQIFCSSYNGLFSINIENQQIQILSKTNGLSDAGVSSMAYDAKEKTLILAYRSGNIDLVSLNDSSEPEQITKWPVFNSSANLPDQKQVNRILLREDLAYLATNFGIVVLDTKLRQVEETYRYIGKNGTELNVKDITFASDSIYALTDQGVLASSMHPTVNRQYFANWKPVITPFPAVSIFSKDEIMYAGFQGKGIYKKSGGSWILVYPSSGKFYSFSTSDGNLVVTLENNVVIIPATGQSRSFESPLFKALRESLLTDSQTIWTADHINGLISNVGGQFKSYGVSEKDTTINPKTDSTVIDQNGLAWSRLPSYLGGGISVKNLQTGQQRVLTTALGNGGLPSSVVNSLSIDTDGYLWFAGDKGVGYIMPDEILNEAQTDAILPIYGQRKLFANEICSALAVEPGNRKWIGTHNGLYQFNADGTELIGQFTTEESPLPSDHIRELRFEKETGILFIDTPNGMVSYRSNSTISSEDLSSITIFPNPVRPGYGGQVGIKGLMDKSVVKITQLSGRLVYETRAQGGTASWNLSDYTGRRVTGGIYLVIVVSSNGERKVAGKLAIIN